MSIKSAQIISLIMKEEFHKARETINETMNEKLGILLEEKLVECAPSLFEAKKVCDCGEKNCDCGKVKK